MDTQWEAPLTGSDRHLHKNDLLSLRTVDEVAAEYGVTRQAVHRWLNDGKLEGKKLGGVWRITLHALNEFSFNNQKKRKRSIQRSKTMLTPDEVAAECRVGAACVRKWLNDGKLKGTRLGGGVWRITREALSEFKGEVDLFGGE